MNHRTIARAVVCLLVGAAILATIVAFVPAPVQILALLIALPVESLLIAIATSSSRRPIDQHASRLG